jgi:hypothetical protein
LQLLCEIFQRDELRSAKPLLETLNSPLETTFNAAHGDQLARVFLTILRRYPNSNCGATVDGRAENPDESSKRCGYWTDRRVFNQLAEGLEASRRFEEIFFRIMLLAREEERILCLTLFYGHCNKVVDWFLSFYDNDINVTWRLVLKLVSFMMAQVRSLCHGYDLMEAPCILMTRELEEYFCAFMYYTQVHQPNWHQLVSSCMSSDWRCTSCKADASLRCQLEAVLLGLRFNDDVDGSMG